MTYVEVIDLVVRVGSILLAIVTTTLLVISKIKNAKKSGESINIGDYIDIITESNIVDIIENIEKSFSDLKSNGKTGVLKKELALGQMRDFCISKNLSYDRDFWSETIDKFVSLINLNKGNTKYVVQLGTDNEQKNIQGEIVK